MLTLRMRIDEEALRDFKSAYQEAYDEELKDGEARLLLQQMGEFYLLVAAEADENKSQAKK